MTSFLSTFQPATSAAFSGVTLPPQLFLQLFPFHLVFNRHGSIVQVGEVLQRLYVSLAADSPIEQHFKINSPVIALEFEAIRAQSGCIFVLESKQNGIQFKGSMVYVEEQDALYFLGFPWLTDLESLARLGLTFNDFAIHAPMAEFLLLLQAHKNALLESKNLTQELSEQRIKLHETLQQAKLATAELKAIFETSPDLYFRLRTDGMIQEYYAGKTSQLYAPPEAFIGKTLQEVMPGNVAQLSYQALRKVVQTNTLVTIEYSLPIQNTEKFFEARFFPFLEQQVIVIVRDISDRKQAEEANTLLVTAVKHAADIIEITDAEARLQYVNSAFEKVTGYSSAEVLGKTADSLLHTPEDKEAFNQSIWKTISSGQVWNGCLLGRRKDGTIYPQEATISPVYSGAGIIANYVILKRDITERKRTEEQLEQSLSILRGTLEATADGILVGDSGKIVVFNQKFVDMWGIPESVIESKDQNQVVSFVLDLLKEPAEFLCKTMNLFGQPDAQCYEIYELKDGRVFERYSQPQWIGGKITGRVCSFRDITERKQAEETIRYQALHDILTGLPNRTLFNERLAESLANASENQSSLAVMFLDLDRFKTINDTLGHAVGDRLLQGVAKRLKSCLREGDVVARWGGDEFTLLLSHITCKNDAAKIAQRILDTFKVGFDLETHYLHISSSIGIALYPFGGENAEALIKNADAALYRAKEDGRNNYHFYTSTMNSKASELLALENSLHQALEREELVLYYQPQVNITTGEVTQMEVLMRWLHPQLGLILPETFIPIVEENGLIVAIGEWILRTACTQNKAWQDAGLPRIGVAVNLSARQFQQPNSVEKVARILQETGLPASCLELEITETTVMQNADLTSGRLREFHSMGVRLSLDGFGSGYSSLSYLKNFPFNTLKIDRSFLDNLAPKSKDAAIIRAIIALGKGLNIRVVAEGVETSEQKDLLTSLDCEEMQGDLFSQPLSAEEATQQLIRAGLSKVLDCSVV
ncbi:EAL domain-containing protein [Microcoleus sp. FACHB-672]|uniref:EAL domain-containing protein n=1 Tax=Microcoleus sp. FACHB-672 TaxID=2692825 RepID=UPI0016843E1A|nr:EAL domain-containing protein [Microcoleus sp. FACHB-672]MBD2039401.1 EAL domain-containing protein [Microcoleus sp. FACHB-672]